MSFFDRFEMNSARVRFDKLMADGLLGARRDRRGRAERRPRPRGRRPRWRRSPQVLAAPATVLAHRQSRVAVLDPASGHVALATLGEVVGGAWATPRRAGTTSRRCTAAGTPHGVDLAEPSDDTSIMAFLVDATSGRYELADVAQRFLGGRSPRRPRRSSRRTPSDAALVADAQLVARLREQLRAEIARWELGFVYEQVELPLVKVLGRMEARGVRVDVGLLRIDLDGVRRRGRAPRRRDPEGRRPRVQGQLLGRSSQRCSSTSWA